MSTPPHKKDKAESLQTSIACKGSVCWVVALGLSCASRAWTLTGFACLLATDGNGDGTLRRRRVQVVQGQDCTRARALSVLQQGLIQLL